jgi:lipoate-protein ligase A
MTSRRSGSGGVVGDEATVRCFVAEAAGVARALALGEILLDRTAGEDATLWVHLWRPAETAVVLGSACRLTREVVVDTCRARGIAVYRRVTGGGTVVIGPGTWCYTFVWTRDLEPGTIGAAFDRVHTVIIAVLAKHGLAARSEPISDLVVEVPAGGILKIAGHGQKRRRTGTVCGGSLLAAPFSFPMGEILYHPPREPPYRAGRPHDAFLTSLEAQGVTMTFAAFTRAVMDVTGAAGAEAPDPDLERRAEKLARERYQDPGWTERL